MADMRFVPGLGWVSVPAPIDKSWGAPERRTEGERAAPGIKQEGQRFWVEGSLMKHEIVGEEGDKHKHEELEDPGVETGHKDSYPNPKTYKPDESVDSAEGAEDLKGGGKVEDDPTGGGEDYEGAQNAEEAPAGEPADEAQPAEGTSDAGGDGGGGDGGGAPTDANPDEQKKPWQKAVVLKAGQQVSVHKFAPVFGERGIVEQVAADGSVAVRVDGRLHVYKQEDLMPL